MYHEEADVSPREAATILGALLLLGLALRALTVGRAPLWADEALTAILVRYPWWSLAWTSIDPSPPLFYWLEQALVPQGAGPTEWRMVSLVAGVATIPLTYWLGREMKSRGSGLVAAGLVAVSAPLIDYSQEARAYALTVAMITGSAAALAALTGGRLAGEAQRPARRRMLAVFALFTVLAAFSHFIAMFWIFPALMLLRLASDGHKRLIDPREMLATIGGMLPFLAIEVRRLFVYRSEQNNFTWLAQLSPARIVQILGEQWLPFASIGGLAAAVAGGALLLALLWTVRRVLAQWARSSPLQALILVILLLEPLGLWLLGKLAVPVAMPRTMLPASIGFAVIAGIAAASLKRRGSVVAGTVLVGLSLASTLMTGTVRAKEQWAAAAAASRGAPLVITCPNWKTPAYLAEAKGEGVVVTSYADHALIVRHSGDTASWDRLYFARVQRYGHPIRSDPQLRLQRRPVAASRLLFVASECSEIERNAFAQWAGLTQFKILWYSPRTGEAAAIQVEEWRLKNAEPLDLWIVN